MATPNVHTCIKGDALVGDPICDPGEAAKGLIFCTGLDNNAAKVISLVESAFDLIGAGEATEDVDGEDVIGWPLTNLSNKDPDPVFVFVALPPGSTSVLSNACKFGADSLPLLASLIDLTIKII